MITNRIGLAVWLAIALLIGPLAVTGAAANTVETDLPGSGGSGTVSSADGPEICTLFAPEAVAANDRFGTSIGIDGDVMVVGAWLADVEDQRDAGAAYIYSLASDGSRWAESQRLQASAPEAEAGFGFAVDLDRDIAAVSAQNATADSIPDAGAVYVFEPGPDGDWVETARLTAPTPAPGDLFGHNLEVDGPTATIVVGVPGADPPDVGGQLVEDGGAAHVFVRDGAGTWVHQAELVDPAAKPNDRAGNDVAIADGWAVVGHHLDDPFVDRSISNAGGALVYRRSGATWSGPTELVGSDPRRRDRAGVGVDIDSRPDGPVLVMTGWAQETEDRAVAWVFRYDGERWVEQTRIEPQHSTSPGSHFGRHVELSGDLLIIGASLDSGPLPGPSRAGDPNATDRGAVHIYGESDGFWLERAKLAPANAVPGAQAGLSLALSQDWVAIGAERAELGAANTGGVCLARRSVVIDGSYAPDRRFAVTASVAGLADGSSQSGPTIESVSALVGAAVLLVMVAVGLFRRRGRSD